MRLLFRYSPPRLRPLAMTACASAQEADYGQPSDYSEPVEAYSEDEIVEAMSDFFGVTAEAAAAAVERVVLRSGASGRLYRRRGGCRVLSVSVFAMAKAG